MSKTLSKTQVAGIVAGVTVGVLVAVGLGVGLGVDWKGLHQASSVNLPNVLKPYENMINDLNEKRLRVENAKSKMGPTNWWWNKRYPELLKEMNEVLQPFVQVVKKDTLRAQKALTTENARSGTFIKFSKEYYGAEIRRQALADNLIEMRRLEKALEIELVKNSIEILQDDISRASSELTNKKISLDIRARISVDNFKRVNNLKALKIQLTELENRVVG